jgi:hypothetical protein
MTRQAISYRHSGLAIVATEPREDEGSPEPTHYDHVVPSAIATLCQSNSVDCWTPAGTNLVTVKPHRSEAVAARLHRSAIRKRRILHACWAPACDAQVFMPKGLPKPASDPATWQPSAANRLR